MGRKFSSGIPPFHCPPGQPRCGTYGVNRTWLLVPNTLHLLRHMPIVLAGETFGGMRYGAMFSPVLPGLVPNSSHPSQTPPP